ncbi:3-hydroxyacyl-CoA dehydrogenase family protein [uncultured Oscillibacter sp.]|uniref:3-hydroxyacyl-CoA dehydrogenase family protein n=1 Tax=uncultured Oscillibacter sp. TaxID=876091 RepID=UPI0025E71E72|nr:3-hydroxyacyl-CoA dehydrogenase family protein [uncultured Oscillibacter sp.]
MSMKKIGVVGAGMMGSEIALCFARSGMNVILADIKQEFAEGGKRKQEAILSKQVAKGRMSEEQKADILARVTPTVDLDQMADCDFVIEAVLEKLEIKADTFRKLDAICKPETILASNTSSISISKLAASVSRERAPRFLGMHFNSPASVMKLVEVIPGLLTSDETADMATELLLSIEKEPVRVKDVTGFALNRLFHCFYGEALRLIEEGVATPEDIDKICVYGLGHPIGICKLLDQLGHDLNISVDQILFDAYGDRFRPSPVLQRFVDSGLLGRKSGEGFYTYEKK